MDISIHNVEDITITQSNHDHFSTHKMFIKDDKGSVHVITLFSEENDGIPIKFKQKSDYGY